MSNREELIKELKIIHDDTHSNFHANTLEGLADFIIEDRKRVVEPLVQWNKWDKEGLL